MRKNRSTYKSCSDLPLYNFIQVLINDKKELLYNRPNKTWYKQADLDAIWDDIFLEYIELCNDQRSKAVLELQKEIKVSEHKINIIQQIIIMLSGVSDVSEFMPSIELLKKYGFGYSFTNATLLDDLKRVAKSAKQLVIHRDQLQKELNAINKNEQEKATEKDFSVHLANISETMGFAIDTKNTSVMQYVGYLERFNSKIAHERTVNTRNS